jgi:hypothetical protein
VRAARDQDGNETADFSARGRVYYRDDPLMAKPRLLAEIEIPAETARFLTMEKLIEFAEERMQLDIHEIAMTGPYALDGVHHGKAGLGIDVLRKAMVR